MRNEAISAAVRLCDTMIRKFPDAKELPPEQRFFYHQGVFLSGMMNTYELCGEERYYDYVKAWIDSLVDEHGKINSNTPHDWLDDIQPGILLYPLYKKTKDNKYKIALDFLVNILKNWKKNKSGGFWHSNIHPDQMWLDSLYMGSPILAQYAKEFNCPELWEETANQAIIMYENMTNPETGLMLHAWDESRKEEWADKNTGLSDETWGRAQGWYVVAIMDILSFMPEDHPYRQKLIDIERAVLMNIIKYRDEKSKLWYQIVPKQNEEGNWIENSCSFLFITAIAKAVRLGVLDKSYKNFANECFAGALRNIDSDGEDLLINHVCIGTCIFDYQGYIDRPTSVNDLHGTGAFLLMCSEIARIN